LLVVADLQQQLQIVLDQVEEVQEDIVHQVMGQVLFKDQH
jgi:hypothetical protein